MRKIERLIKDLEALPPQSRAQTLQIYIQKNGGVPEEYADKIRSLLSEADRPIQTTYICNRKKLCKNSPRCGNDCTHTTDIRYAKNRGKTMIFAELGEDFLYEQETLEGKAFAEKLWRAQEEAVAELKRRKEQAGSLWNSKESD